MYYEITNVFTYYNTLINNYEPSVSDQLCGIREL